MKITEEQAKVLNKAIDLAKSHGTCRYVCNSGKPLCVIAQLCVLEGIPLSKFTDNSEVIGGYLFRGELEELKYPSQLLSNLQSVWDSKKMYPKTDVARKAMRRIVKESLK